MENCPSPDDWFSLGENEALDGHLDRCADCRKLAAMLGRAEVLGTAPTGSTDDVGLVPELMPPGTELGRFIVRGAIGVGGMGVVLEAFDPKLERTVALKVVRKLRDDDAWRSARDRVFAEAKAMARLAHPNVVAIHDLIEVGEERLIAMEYVAGPDLEAWLAGGPTRRQRLHVVLGLGEGIAAAHDAGVIHRDIKPSNVLVANGTARVTDFGLAALTGMATRRAHGTVGYAAPEVGDSLGDARSDQYSFGVTAWRTMFDAWPADGPRRGRVARVLRRAMSIDPEDRFPTMRATLRALETAARRPPVAAIAGVVAVVLVGGAAAMMSRSHAREACELDPSLESVWSDEIRARWQSVMGARFGIDASNLTSEVEGAWTTWQTATALACKSTDVGVLACLGSQRRQLASFVDHAPVAQTPAAVEEALATIRKINCTNAPAPAASLLSPALQQRHEELNAELDEVAMLFFLAEYSEALGRLDSISARVPPEDEVLRGEILYRRAEVLTRFGDMKASVPVFEQALAIGERTGNPVARMNAMIELLLDYDELGDLAKANALIPAAEALARTLPFDPGRAGRLANALGSIAAASGRYEEAERHYREFETLREREANKTGGNSVGLAGAWHNLGLVIHAQGRLDEATVIQNRALAMFEITLGPSHPSSALPVGELASLAREQGHFDQAEVLYRRTIANWEHALGPDHPQLSEPILGLAMTEAGRHDYDRAVVDYLRALTLATKFGTDQPLLAQAEYRLALELARRGLPDDALALTTLSVTGWDNNKVEDPDAHRARFLLARQVWTRGDHPQARALAETARAGLARRDQRFNAEVQEIAAWLASHP